MKKNLTQQEKNLLKAMFDGDWKPAQASKIELLKERIKERLLIIYVLESALLDNEPKVPKAYKICMKDEIENHKAAIADYEQEINNSQTLTTPNTEIQ